MHWPEPTRSVSLPILPVKTSLILFASFPFPSLLSFNVKQSTGVRFCKPMVPVVALLFLLARKPRVFLIFSFLTILALIVMHAIQWYASPVTRKWRSEASKATPKFKFLPHTQLPHVLPSFQAFFLSPSLDYKLWDEKQQIYPLKWSITWTGQGLWLQLGVLCCCLVSCVVV